MLLDFRDSKAMSCDLEWEHRNLLYQYNAIVWGERGCFPKEKVLPQSETSQQRTLVDMSFGCLSAQP